MGLLGILWLAGIVGYFALTTERQRRNPLVVMWILLGLGAIVPFIALLIKSL